MTGENLREVLKAEGIELKTLAASLNMSPQALNSKLNAKKVSIDFIESISSTINKNVYSVYSSLNNKKVGGNSDKMADLMNNMFDEVKENNIFFRKLINTAVQAGAIKFDKNSAIHV